jgi:hypothetical protein
MANQRIKKMIFEFEKKTYCNRDRFYPTNDNAKALVELAKREVLYQYEIDFLKKNGWNIRWSPK